MSPHESSPLHRPQARDLDAEVQIFVHKISSAIEVLKTLYPLDSPEKTEQATPWWNQIYDIIGFTTIDIELEKVFLNHPDILKLIPEVRQATINCEAAFEVTWSDRIALARDPTEGTTPS